MEKYEHIDLLLGQALECIVEAAGELKSIKERNHFNETKNIGTAIGWIWEVRDKIYEINPEIKRDFVKEKEDDKQRFDELDKILKKAAQAEYLNDFESAISLYTDLLEKSENGYFTLLSEAGLYRLLNKKT